MSTSERVVGPLASKKILLAVSGSIAAYKAVFLLRRLQDLGAEIRVCMSESAQQFVGALTFEALSRHPVLNSSLKLKNSQIEHIESAYWADMMLVVPATANTISKLAQGMASDALTTCALSLKAPLLIAPAMEARMYNHSATRANLEVLKNRGALIIEPQSGLLASGRSGVGRLAEIDEICKAVVSCFNNLSVQNNLQNIDLDLKNKDILITAGPTVEDIDPVRFITNRSSGKMGLALAQNALKRGAKVTFIHGPMSLELPENSKFKAVAIRSAEDLAQAVFKETFESEKQPDVIIMAAAVADYTPKLKYSQKMKKKSADLKLELARTRDILSELGASDYQGMLVGFAAETENVIENGRSKLQRKNADLICVNDVSGSTFGGDQNHIIVLTKDDGEHDLGANSKQVLAQKILDFVV